MERKMFTLTEKQLKKCAVVELPSDEHFQQVWKSAHHGKLAGWGMGKRTFIISAMSKTPEYQTGIWQGRVDKANGLDYSEDRIDAPYNLGYFRGYTEYESNRRGWDAETRQWFDSNYVEA